MYVTTVLIRNNHTISRHFRRAQLRKKPKKYTPRHLTTADQCLYNRHDRKYCRWKTSDLFDNPTSAYQIGDASQQSDLQVGRVIEQVYYNDPPARERDWAEYRKIIAGLRLIDDDFMSIAFNNDNELTAFVLRIILEKDDLIVTKVRTQAESKSATNSAADCPSLKSGPSRKPSTPDPQRRIAALLFC